MEINANLVKELRERTGAAVMDCKKALQESGGDLEKAIDRLREKGLKASVKKASRTAKEGLIGSYIHPGSKIGVLVEVNCETDFVARTADFQELVKNLAMHIAAASPLYLSRDDVPQDVLSKERDLYRTQALQTGKPEKVIEKIVDGKVDKFYGEICLLEQSYVREPELTIKSLIDAQIGKIGENIVLRRFCRFQLGEAGE
ncbi:MAG TPA: translation elongation factor Ts [Thermodesulfobacteriota bacterium]|nr:translation elongation factor Ts [Thermodesulfobacteriota bacterium]HNU71046.1 translation elongation factor Ts [Thermodesulfobacteriota bacterium]HOC37726.1 translation elongation factor Ts [Thermodesulfobacteriota bacterium]HQO77138.1 translation elongation factor Ts [Thermodesulfobacteriota bacterium]